jgi:ribosomal protein L1
MDEDELNLSIRKFLKKVGITSQREIEKAIRSAIESGQLNDNGSVDLSMTLKMDHLASDLVIDGQIKLQP